MHLRNWTTAWFLIRLTLINDAWHVTNFYKNVSVKLRDKLSVSADSWKNTEKNQKYAECYKVQCVSLSKKTWAKNRKYYDLNNKTIQNNLLKSIEYPNFIIKQIINYLNNKQHLNYFDKNTIKFWIKMFPSYKQIYQQDFF